MSDYKLFKFHGSLNGNKRMNKFKWVFKFWYTKQMLKVCNKTEGKGINVLLLFGIGMENEKQSMK